MNKHVVVAMSGGVDSSVSAALLVEQGYQVTGIMMRLWAETGVISGQRDNRCCTRDQMLDAHFVAKKLGIPFQVIDTQDIFKQKVVDPFVDGYGQGITPNPCLACNRHIRFTFLLEEALSRGATHLATGHYAQIIQTDDGEYELHKGVDAGKDQSYVLSVLTQDQLKHAMFPIGGFTKSEVRQLAQRFGLPVASKVDSQDLCFVADGDYRRFLRAVETHVFKPGPIKLLAGEQIGTHQGLPDYTIGQRKGLGISWSEPLYVIAKDTQTNTLIVGTRGELGNDTFQVRDTNWIAGHPPVEAVQVEVKIRYKVRPVIATVFPVGRNKAEVKLDDPLPDITPGQGAVFYKGNQVIGCGLIASPVESQRPPSM
jgi:tRNA-specific 2-thiouridylase